MDIFIDLSFLAALGLTSPFSPTISIAYKNLVGRYNICIGIKGRCTCFRGSCPRAWHYLEDARGARTIVSTRIQAGLTPGNIDSCRAIRTKYLVNHRRYATASSWRWPWCNIGGYPVLLYGYPRRGIAICSTSGNTNSLTNVDQIGIGNTVVRCKHRPPDAIARSNPTECVTSYNSVSV